MAEQTPAPEMATNFGHSRRHISRNLGPGPYGTPGRRGKSVCPREVDVYDEEAINAVHAAYRGGKPPVVVADLAECKECARIRMSEATDHG